MGDRHGDRLIDCKAEKGGIGSRFIIVGGSDICGTLYAGRDRGKRIGAVDIDGAPGLEAGSRHDIRLSTGHSQVRNG